MEMMYIYKALDRGGHEKAKGLICKMSLLKLGELLLCLREEFWAPDTKVCFVEIICHIPSKSPILSALLHNSVEKCNHENLCFTFEYKKFWEKRCFYHS